MDMARIKVTLTDIESAKRYDWEDPITNALGRVTGTLWLISDIPVAIEATAPYRKVILRGEVFAKWCAYKSNGALEPFEFEAEVLTRNRTAGFS